MPAARPDARLSSDEDLLDVRPFVGGVDPRAVVAGAAGKRVFEGVAGDQGSNRL